jgi:hypothetical protein
MDQRTTITAAASSRKVTPTGDARWRVHWKDDVTRNIRFTPLDGAAEQDWSHTVYRTKTADQTVQAQARPVLPDEVGRKPSREPERDVPWACANRQHQDLALMTAEPCSCNPEQVRRCAEQLATVIHSEAMLQHDRQVVWMQQAASYILDYTPLGAGMPWKTDIGKTVESKRHVALKQERWRAGRFRTVNVGLLTEQQIGAAFVATLYVADDLDEAFSRQNTRSITLYCDAPTSSARAYQAACSELTAYHDLHSVGPSRWDLDGVWRHHDFSEQDTYAARIVTQVFEGCLPHRDIKQSRNPVDDIFIVARMLDRTEDLTVSSYKLAKLYGLDASTVRERFNRALADIDQQLEKYCKGYNALAYTPQTVSPTWYNIISDEIPVSERLVRPRERAHVSVPYDPVSRAKQKNELSALKRSACHDWFGFLSQVLPPGTACHYTGFMPYNAGDADVREYPSQPYGTEPLRRYLPQPAHSFKKDTSTSLPSLGLPFDDKFKRWAKSWLNIGAVHEYGRDKQESKSDSDDDDLVNKLKAHGDRGDDRINRIHDAYEFEVEEEEKTPFFDD